MRYLLISLLLTICGAAVRADVTADAKQILETAGVSAGFVVHLGADDGLLTAALKQNDRIQVHGLIRDAASVAPARARLRDADRYGGRVGRAFFRKPTAVR